MYNNYKEKTMETFINVLQKVFIFEKEPQKIGLTQFKEQKEEWLGWERRVTGWDQYREIDNLTLIGNVKHLSFKCSGKQWKDVCSQ